jgi:hypothetical protein
MQSPSTVRSPPPQPQPVNHLQGLTSPRGERAADESARPTASVALEPKWAAAIDAATD